MGSPVCAAAEAGTKAPARSAEMAKRAPDTASEYGRIFKSSSICNLSIPTETRHGYGDDQHKSISGPFDKTTFRGAASSTPRAHALRDGARPQYPTQYCSSAPTRLIE